MSSESEGVVVPCSVDPGCLRGRFRVYLNECGSIEIAFEEKFGGEWRDFVGAMVIPADVAKGVAEAIVKVSGWSA